MNSHMLMPIDVYRDHPATAPFTDQQVRMIEANVAANNSVMACSCNTLILALEWRMIVGEGGAHAKHLAAVVKARRA